MTSMSLTPGPWQRRIDSRLSGWQEARFAERLWAKDPTLWSERPVAQISDRLGWLDLPETALAVLADVASLAREVADEGTRRIVLLGMGGSSLAPEVFHETFGSAPGYPELIVLDSTHPDAVRAASSRVDVARALFVVSSKSGTTLETLSFYRHFWERASREIVGADVVGGSAPGRRFVAITDPGTPLERLARERAFRRVVSAPVDIGGRYSALSAFGIAPAALIGADTRRLLDAARAMAAACGPSLQASSNPGLALGAALAELSAAGRDKLTFVTSPALDSFPAWIEQLIAESTGKGGRGIVPVTGESLAAPDTYGADRVFASIALLDEDDAVREGRLAALEAAGHPIIRFRLDERTELGGEMFRWEIATAAAGAAMRIDPFDQPDVELAKDLARQAMKAGAGGRLAAGGRAGSGAGGGAGAAGSAGASDIVRASDAAELGRTASAWLSSARPGDFAAIQAYLAPSPGAAAALESIRLALRDRLRIATTVGYGPRFLHSTGQLHKGGPNSALVLQIIDEPREDLAVPETDFSFGALIRAQAAGDAQALAQRGRRVLRVGVGADVAAGLARIRSTVSQ